MVLSLVGWLFDTGVAFVSTVGARVVGISGDLDRVGKAAHLAVISRGPPGDGVGVCFHGLGSLVGWLVSC